MKITNLNFFIRDREVPKIHLDPNEMNCMKKKQNPQAKLRKRICLGCKGIGKRGRKPSERFNLTGQCLFTQGWQAIWTVHLKSNRRISEKQ